MKPNLFLGDINILNGLGVENSKMIAHLFEIQPEAVSLVHFIRQWLKSQEFEGFKGYLITLLVIFFLQNKNFLPTGENIKRGVLPKVINGELPRIASFLYQYSNALLISRLRVPVWRYTNSYFVWMLENLRLQIFAKQLFWVLWRLRLHLCNVNRQRQNLQR